MYVQINLHLAVVGLGRKSVNIDVKITNKQDNELVLGDGNTHFIHV